MGDVINIKAFDDKEYTVIINPKLALTLGLDGRLKGIIGYGTQKCFVDIKNSTDVQENEMYLSKDAADYLYLPEYPDFEVRVKNGEIIIGPHLGIVYRRKDEEITGIILQDTMKFISDYQKLHGSVILFAQDKVDTSKRLIEGYCYNHKSKAWERGIFPYPQSIYVQSSLDLSLKNSFLSAIGDTVFNNWYLDKYMVIEYLSSDREIANHLPDTVLYKNTGDIFSMLKIYGKVYVKPVSGTKGIGVVRISSGDDRTDVKWRDGGNNMEKSFDNPDECRRYLEKLFTPNGHIIQEPIDVMTYKGGVTDFRLMIQKDPQAGYVCKGIVAKIGAPDSIVSNVFSGGALVWGADLLKKLNFSDSEAKTILDDIKSLGLKICSVLADKGINYGDLGFDIGLDNKKRLWLIEINSLCPDPRAALLVNDLALYKNLVTAPLLYAKFLSGF